MAAKRGRRSGEPNLRVRATWNSQRFAAALEASGLSQAQLSRQSGVPYRNIQLYLRGKANPGGAILIALADALQVRAESLYDIEATELE